MKLKDRSSRKSSKKTEKSPRRVGKFNTLCRIVFFLNVVALAIFVYLTLEHRWFLTRTFDSLDRTFGVYDVKYTGTLIKQRIQGVFAKPEVLQIDIKHLNVQNLEFQRYKALEGNINFAYVPASITYNGDKYKTKLRLKGDRSIHFEHLNTASYRVKITGNKTLWGMKFFSLHKPRARNYIHEWIFLRMMKHEGIISPRYKFIRLVVNGKDNGIYAVEEHYTKLLLENNQSREGPILRFDESTGTNYTTSTITPYEQKKWLSADNLPTTQKGIQLIEGYRRGELVFGDVFETTKWATFFAISDVTSSRHALVSKSLRIYYNPITSKLEPIPFDGHYGTGDERYPLIAAELGITKEHNWTYAADRGWFFGLFNDPDKVDHNFLAAYVKALKKVSDSTYLDSFFDATNSDLKKNLAIINNETNAHDNVFSFGPIPYVYKQRDYYDIAQHIRSLLEPKLESFVLDRNDEHMVIQVVNRHKALPVVVLGAGCERIAFEPQTLMNIPARTHASEEAEPMAVKLRKVEDESLANGCLRLFVRMPGLDTVHSVPLRPWKPTNSRSLSSDTLRKASNYHSYDYFELADENKLIIRPGTHVLEDTVIVDGVDLLEILPGTTLVLRDSASLIVRTPVVIRGSPEQPVNIRGEGGGGFAVIDAGGLSEIEHANFSSLANIEDNDWVLSGAVTFYESPVVIKNTKFASNISEDAFNAIRTRVRMEDSEFEHVLRDAIDVDFGELEASGLRFEKVGNDAIDISGTTASVESISISQVGDKAISVGERSTLSGRHINIKNAKIGIASKDASTVTIENLNLVDTEIGYAVFQKKPEHGPARIQSNSPQHSNVTDLSVIEVGSALVVNGIEYPGDLEDIRDRLYDE